jgi:hypothetical protein
VHARYSTNTDGVPKIGGRMASTPLSVSTELRRGHDLCGGDLPAPDRATSSAMSAPMAASHGWSWESAAARAPTAKSDVARRPRVSTGAPGRPGVAAEPKRR